MYAYDWLVAVSTTDEAEQVRINFDTKSLFYNGRPIIVGNTYMAPVAYVHQDHARIVTLDGLIAFKGDPYVEIARLYDRFKRSIPSPCDQTMNENFMAYSGALLTDHERHTGIPRIAARLQLEGFILLASCAGILQWRNPMQPVWQGVDPDLILRRKWIV